MKKIIPIFLVICTLFSVFSIFTISAHAAVGELIAGGLIGLGYFCIGELLSEIGGQAGGALASSISDFQREHDAFIKSNSTILFEMNGSVPTFSINDEYAFSGVEYEITQEIVTELNQRASSDPFSTIKYDTQTGTFIVQPSAFSDIKSTITNKVTKAIYADSINKSMSDLTEAADVPLYSFDFVGPILPELNVPGVYGPKALSRDGYTFSLPHIFDSYYLTAAEANVIAASIPGSEVYEFTKDSYHVKFGAGCYGYSFYVIYDGKIYYSQTYTSYSSDPYTEQQRYFPLNTFASDFVASDGSKLATGRASLLNTASPYTCGVVVNTDNTYNSGNPSFYPVSTDFEGESGGGSFTIPRTDDENNTGLGIGLGLIGNSDLIELNPDGTFKSVGGIDMAKLAELIEKLKTGSLDFENVQEYLELIAQLVGNSNLTAQEQKTILDNINANTASIAQAIAEAKAIDIDKVNVDFSTFLFEHIGFKEAAEIVDGLPIVNQCKTLLNNLFGRFSDNSKPPNFSFYWDSNKDGITEKYTVLDLSFMENTLSNGNLEDKNRFQKPMTIRTFIQCLIVLICYTAFVIKLLKKLPGLLGGVESFESDLNTTSHIESRVK